MRPHRRALHAFKLGALCRREPHAKVFTAPTSFCLGHCVQIDYFSDVAKSILEKLRAEIRREERAGVVDDPEEGLPPIVAEAIKLSRSLGGRVTVLEVESDSLTDDDEKALYEACIDSTTNDEETRTLYTGEGWRVEVWS